MGRELLSLGGCGAEGLTLATDAGRPCPLRDAAGGVFLPFGRRSLSFTGFILDAVTQACK